MWLQPGAGASIDLAVGRPTVKVGPPLSAQVGVVDGVLSPGSGFQTPHWHEDLDEVFYVLEGEIEFLLDGRWQRASAGTTIFVPAGMVHAFRNASGRPARQLVIGPAEVAELIAELGEYPRERWEEVHERHRSHYFHPVAEPGGFHARRK
jgi:uncharacterized cupin superfamily protein